MIYAILNYNRVNYDRAAINGVACGVRGVMTGVDGTFSLAGGAPSGNGPLVQSGRILRLECPDTSGTVVVSSCSGFWAAASASSHLSLDTSVPPVLRDLKNERNKLAKSNTK